MCHCKVKSKKSICIIILRIHLNTPSFFSKDDCRCLIIVFVSILIEVKSTTPAVHKQQRHKNFLLKSSLSSIAINPFNYAVNVSLMIILFNVQNKKSLPNISFFQIGLWPNCEVTVYIYIHFI